MLQILDSNHRDVVVVKATGLLTDEDYRKFVPELEKIIRETGPVSVLLEFENFRGWEPKALWTDFKVGIEHKKDFKKLAVVGEKTWHHLFAAMAGAFIPGQVRYFNHDQIQEAWDWILDKKEAKQDGSEKKSQQAVPEVTPYNSIVVAMDFSPHALKALKRAILLARDHGASVSVVHAYQSLALYETYPDDLLGPSPAMPIYDQELDQQLFETAQRRLEEMVSEIDYPHVSAEVVWGSPRATVISYAETRKADLIVAGSHGRKGIARLLGSTANGIMHSARCDVLIVRLD